MLLESYINHNRNEMVMKIYSFYRSEVYIQFVQQILLHYSTVWNNKIPMLKCLVPLHPVGKRYKREGMLKRAPMVPKPLAVGNL